MLGGKAQLLAAMSLLSLSSAASIGLSLGSSSSSVSSDFVTVDTRSLTALGGWSLSAVDSTCPSGTATCFSNLTGIVETSNRGQECCPSGTTPELRCGTYVNTGQPYACCPIDNADCRGDVEKSNSTNVCANSGWALWEIPDQGYNRFCCLPEHYGYWYPDLGQDAVGRCTADSDLPTGTLPGVQIDNGDGSVDMSGAQLTALPTATPTPAPTCDITHYGWSLQTNVSSCTAGSNLCPTGGSCCPSTLQCGSVVGDSEVPVCCPGDNPDCRGDVEGLWPQVCSDSSWAMWHVNTNGNHFCCLPGQIGYNIINDNAAIGYCGPVVPQSNNVTKWMRSILDYEGDGSTAGSFASFPCDTTPAPNASWPSIIGQLLNPPPSLNDASGLDAAGYPDAAPLYANVTASISFVEATYTTTLTGGAGGAGGSGGSGAKATSRVTGNAVAVYETTTTLAGGHVAVESVTVTVLGEYPAATASATEVVVVATRTESGGQVVVETSTSVAAATAAAETTGTADAETGTAAEATGTATAEATTTTTTGGPATFTGAAVSARAATGSSLALLGVAAFAAVFL